MAFPVQQRVEIIRASCDNCAKSKVRCSKDQPSCQRCLYQGVPCIYSPSQRSRKRPPPTPPPGAAPHSQGVASTRDRNDGSILDACLGSQRREDEMDGGQIMADIRTVDMTSPGPLPAQIDTPFSDRTQFPADALSPIKWTELLESFDGNTPSPNELPGISGIPQMPIPSPQSRMDTGNDNSALDEFPWLLPSDSHKQSLWTLPAPHHQSVHQCSQLAMSAISRLDAPMTPCPSLNRSNCPDPRIQPTMGPEARSFDDILKHSHSSLEDVLAILECPCSIKTDLIFLVTTTCTRVLSWYQASLDRSAGCLPREPDSSSGYSESSNGSGSGSRSRSRSSPGAPSSLRSTPESNILQGLSESFREWVSIPSINVGAYTLEPAQSRRMIAQLILAEIDKVKEVLAAFSRRYCRQKGMYGDDDNEKGLHMALEAHLRHQMKSVALTARELLS